VLPVGRRVFVNAPDSPGRALILTDEVGRTGTQRLADGVEVEILAWKPRGGAGTRYRIHSTSPDAEGWVGAEDLRSARHPVPVAAVKPAPAAAAGRVERDESARKFGQRR